MHQHCEVCMHDVCDKFEVELREFNGETEHVHLLVHYPPKGRGGVVIGCLQATYIPGLGKGGGERALIEAVRIRADRRGGGLGRTLMERATGRARERGCVLVQLTSNKSRRDAHRFYTSLGFARSHEGFKLPL